MTEEETTTIALPPKAAVLAFLDAEITLTIIRSVYTGDQVTTILAEAQVLLDNIEGNAGASAVLQDELVKAKTTTIYTGTTMLDLLLDLRNLVEVVPDNSIPDSPLELT